jgi:lactate dehydrogenase-like 2-hydroxyacid dehydrogenase
MMPHVASATHETRRAMTDCMLSNIEEFLRSGKVLTEIV